MSIHREGMSCSDVGRVLVLNGPPDWLLDNGCPLNAHKGYTAEPAISDCCRKRNPGALKALLAHGADPNFINPHPTFSLAFILNSFRDGRLDRRMRQRQGVPPGESTPVGGESDDDDDAASDDGDDGKGLAVVPFSAQPDCVVCAR